MFGGGKIAGQKVGRKWRVCEDLDAIINLLPGEKDVSDLGNCFIGSSKGRKHGTGLELLRVLLKNLESPNCQVIAIVIQVLKPSKENQMS